jgi:DNA repair exonuclease SbcCD ATPase subunit
LRQRFPQRNGLNEQQERDRLEKKLDAANKLNLRLETRLHAVETELHETRTELQDPKQEYDENEN